jgi:hypothetical protein
MLPLTKKLSPKKYVLLAVLSAAVIFLPYVSFNWFIDPYGCFGAPTISGLNAKKTEFRKHAYLSKACAVDRYHLDGVILGSSRAEIGIDPSQIPSKAGSFYNLALPEGKIHTAYRYLQHAIKSNDLAAVILTLDFFMFNAARPQADGFDNRYLSVNADGSENRSQIRAIDLLLSIDTFWAAVDTVKNQRSAGALSLENGMVSTPSLRWDEGPARRGHLAAFKKNEGFYFNGHYQNFTFEAGASTSLGELKNILTLAAENDIQLYLAISPVHARKLEVIAAKGLWTTFEQWKHEIVNLNAQVTSNHDISPYPVWDFTGYNSITTEPVPKQDDEQSRMRWYYESSHYRPALGNLMIARIFGAENELLIENPDFGIRLDRASINDHLRDIRESRDD